MTPRKAIALLAAAFACIFGMGLFHACFGPPVSQTEVTPPLSGGFKFMAFAAGLIAFRLVYWLIMPKKRP